MKPTLVARVFETPPMMKTCTNCKETVREEARRCQFCSYRFDVSASRWPAKLNVAGAIVLGSGLSIAVAASPVIAIPQLAIAGVLFAIGTLGRRASRKKQFARSGPVIPAGYFGALGGT
jgi:hypothetical protein